MFCFSSPEAPFSLLFSVSGEQIKKQKESQCILRHIFLSAPRNRISCQKVTVALLAGQGSKYPLKACVQLTTTKNQFFLPQEETLKKDYFPSLSVPTTEQKHIMKSLKKFHIKGSTDVFLFYTPRPRFSFLGNFFEVHVRRECIGMSRRGEERKTFIK